jgi:general secretion pathway protein G
MKHRRARGFTLIEIVVAAAIVGLLATMVLPLAERAALRERESALRTSLRDLRTAIDAYKAAVDAGRIRKRADESGYPASLDVLVGGVADPAHPDGPRIRFLRRIPRDPFFDDPKVPAAQTWGLRSYASPPDAPEAGDDVFDVHSLSDRVGLNGIPYSEW